MVDIELPNADLQRGKEKNSAASRGVGEESWLNLMDYSMQNGVSLSTLRRYIKAGKVQYRVENGRYLILNAQAGAKAAPPAASSEKPGMEASRAPENNQKLQLKLRELERDLQKAQEEIAELKMLIALYEEQLPQKPFDN